MSSVKLIGDTNVVIRKIIKAKLNALMSRKRSKRKIV